ncbi:hypothetical protein ACFXNW_02420 [Nocardia sp. NPDC059180]|uniref:hypothetical protein n=1 Tax=Nocardia sp. NPDC059180 TaxID=3346761 RepID=UPI00367FB55B
MMMRKFAATSALLIAAIGVATGTAQAQPAPAEGVNVSYEANDKTASIAIDSGSLAVENGRLAIKSADGTVLAGTPLEFRVDDFVFPIAAQLDDRRATLTPQFDMEHAVYKPVALPFQEQDTFKSPYEREKAAFARMKDEISLAATVAGLTTTVIGGIAGCALGALAGGIVTLPVATLFGAGPVVSCLVGGALGAGLIGIAGTILITVPVAIASAIQYFTTINEPFVAPAK